MSFKFLENPYIMSLLGAGTGLGILHLSEDEPDLPISLLALGIGGGIGYGASKMMTPDKVLKIDDSDLIDDLKTVKSDDLEVIQLNDEIEESMPLPLKETTIPDVPVKGINIWSGSNDSLGAALTNPTTLSKRKGKIKNDYPVSFRGQTFPDAEAAYKQYKSGNLDEDIEVMSDIIYHKLNQYPQLAKAITQRGGDNWLSQSFHSISPSYDAKSRWTGTGDESLFIVALKRAYQKYQTIPQEIPKTTSNSDYPISGREIPMNYSLLGWNEKEPNPLADKGVTTTFEAMRGHGRVHTSRNYPIQSYYRIKEGDYATVYDKNSGRRMVVKVGKEHPITPEMINDPEYLSKWSEEEKHHPSLLQNQKYKYGMYFTPVGDLIDGKVIPWS